jgi:polysaccharide biosynthesis protein PslH
VYALPSNAKDSRRQHPSPPRQTVSSTQAGPSSPIPRRMSHRKKVLWIKADPLYPLDSGGKIRTFQMLKQWHARHHITFLALLPAGTPAAATSHAQSYSSEQMWIPWKDKPKGSFLFYLDLLRNLTSSEFPYVIDKYRSADAVRAIAELDRENNYDIVIADFLSMANNIIAAGIAPTKVIVFQHNVESQIWKRHYEVARNPLLRCYMYVQWRRFDRFERTVCRQFKGVIAVSEDDATRFRQEFSLSNVLGHVPTGVDVSFFSVLEYMPEPDHIVFLGSMDWMPNTDGITEFIRTTYPRIKHHRPGVKLTIVGRNPSAVIRKLPHADSSIRVTGTVDDVRPYMARAAVSIVPLRVGGGTRLKIFEAMAMGIPVVSSPIGAEGLPVEDGDNIFIADGADRFAQCVITLLQDPTRARAMGRAGQRMVTENFSWQAAVGQFDRMCSLGMAGK